MLFYTCVGLKEAPLSPSRSIPGMYLRDELVQRLLS